MMKENMKSLISLLIIYTAFFSRDVVVGRKYKDEPLLYKLDVTKSIPLGVTTEGVYEVPKVNLPYNFTFMDKNVTEIWINKNGYISMGRKPYFEVPGEHLPRPIISALWTLLLYKDSSEVYFQDTTDPKILRLASQHVKRSFDYAKPFKAKNVFVVDWKNMQGSDCVDAIANYVYNPLQMDELCRCQFFGTQDFCRCYMESYLEQYCPCVVANYPKSCPCSFARMSKEKDVCLCVNNTMENVNWYDDLMMFSFAMMYCQVEYDLGIYYFFAWHDAILYYIEVPPISYRRTTSLSEPTNRPDDNTFQLVLITDGVRSYVMFNYASINLKPINQLTDRRYPAKARQIGSWKRAWLGNYKGLLRDSNVKVRGRYMYRVDEATIKHPSN